MTRTEVARPTKGAVRAAHSILKECNVRWRDESDNIAGSIELAGIIDRETHAEDMLEALEAILECIPHQSRIKLPLVAEIKGIAEAAIRKAKGDI